jgi:hypothetical protein
MFLSLLLSIYILPFLSLSLPCSAQCARNSTKQDETRITKEGTTQNLRANDQEFPRHMQGSTKESYYYYYYYYSYY